MSRAYRVAVVGLGKIGLPLAAHLAGKGHTVIGADVNAAAVAKHLILFRIVDGGIDVSRVVHGARDLPRLFED